MCVYVRHTEERNGFISLVVVINLLGSLLALQADYGRRVMSNFRNTYRPGSISKVRNVTAQRMMGSVLIYGPFGAGKTRTAATWSPHCPAKLPATEMTYLRDQIWVCAENGLATLMGLNIWPGYVIDLVDLMTEDPAQPEKLVARDFQQAMMWAEREIGHIRKNDPEVTTVVVDTVTSLNAKLQYSMFSRAEQAAQEEKRAVNGQVVWGEIGRTGAAFFNFIQLQGLKSCWLAHPAENMDSLIADQAKIDANTAQSRDASATARGTVTVGTIKPAMSGGIFQKAVKGPIDFQFYIDLETKNGKTERVLKTVGTNTAEGKSRAEHILAASEAPNLLAIEAKLNKAVNVAAKVDGV